MARTFVLILSLFFVITLVAYAQIQDAKDTDSTSQAKQKPKDPCKDPKVAMDPFSPCNNIGYDNYYLGLFESGKINMPPPMGGPVESILSGCFFGATWVKVGAPRPGYYIHAAGITRTYAFGPPRHTGQFLLGLYAPKQFCTKNADSLIVAPGLLITMMGSSR